LRRRPVAVWPCPIAVPDRSERPFRPPGVDERAVRCSDRPCAAGMRSARRRGWAPASAFCPGCPALP